MKTVLLSAFGFLTLWLIVGLIWNRLHPDEEESEDCPYD